MRRIVASSMLVMSVLMAGCSSDGDPVGAGPSPAPSSSSTAWPPDSALAITEPTLPVAADRHDRRGAEAFIRAYVARASYALRSGFPAGVEKYAAQQCTLCTTVGAEVARLNEARHLLDTEGWSVASVAFDADVSTPGVNNLVWRYRVQVDVAPAVERDDQGDEVRTEPARSFDSVIVVSSVMHAWVVYDWRALDQRQS